MGSVPVHESTAAAAIEHWIVMAKTRDLDFYTCMGLVSGLHQLGPKTRAMLPRAVLLVVMQGILPGLLVLYHMRDFQYYSLVQDVWFRLCAVILFCFSVVHMYAGAFDECRTMFLELALRHNVVSWWFLWPMLIGEVLNAFSAYTLVITLSLVFCHVDNTPELLVHCLAINFIVSIDNDIVDDDMRRFSISKLQDALEAGRCPLRRPAHHDDGVRGDARRADTVCRPGLLGDLLLRPPGALVPAARALQLLAVLRGPVALTGALRRPRRWPAAAVATTATLATTLAASALAAATTMTMTMTTGAGAGARSRLSQVR